MPRSAASAHKDSRTPDWDYVAFKFPTSYYSTRESVILRRLELDLTLSSEDNIEPMFIHIEPGSDVAVEKQQLLEIGIDLGKLLSLVPHVPDIFTAKVGTELNIEKVNLKIQASNTMQPHCHWLVADTKIAYNFNPALIAQFSKSRTLTIYAALRVDVRKRVFGVFHKTYGKNASPMWYEYKAGQSAMIGSGYREQQPRSAREYVWPEEKAREREVLRLMVAKGIGGGESMYMLGQLEGSKWYHRAADAGNVDAMVKLGQLAEQAQHRDKAENWYRRAADAGNVDAMVKLGQLAEQAQHRDKAENWYRRAADAGGINGAIKLGQLCGGMPEGKMPEGKKWYEREVGTGNIDGMIKLGQLLEQVQDWDEAENWYRRAADAGNVDAMVKLGQLAEQAHDWDEAENWYRRAADAGNVNAMVRLGQLAEQAQHRDKAENWYRRAADAGSDRAKNWLKYTHPWKYRILRRYRK